MFAFNKQSCVTNQSTNKQINPLLLIYIIFLGTTHTKYCTMGFVIYYNKTNIIRHKKKVELELVLKHSEHFHCSVDSDKLAVFEFFCTL